MLDEHLTGRPTRIRFRLDDVHGDLGVEKGISVLVTSVQELTAAAESEWLEKWTEGPTEVGLRCLDAGESAPSPVLLDETGTARVLSEFWADGPALLMFRRHFGCFCGLGRAARLREEWSRYRDAGLHPVIVGQGEPGRAAAYRADQELPSPILCDPDHDVYRAFGVGHWQVERALYASPPEYWDHPRELGVSFQTERRAIGRPPVDDPWRAFAEFVVGMDGKVRLPYAYQYCDDFPPPELLMASAGLSAPRR